MGALDRKDAWRVDKSWHFFDLDKEKMKREKNRFPASALRSGWELSLKGWLPEALHELSAHACLP
jgi:hypothetical protein